MGFKVKHENGSDIFTFELCKMDFASTRAIEADVCSKMDSCKDIVFDMANVDIITSAFIRLCLEAITRVGKAHFKMNNVKDFVYTVLKTARFTDHVDVQKP